MGDLGSELPPEESAGLPGCPNTTEADGDIKVLVTGFGPFKTNPLNPSFLIASSLSQGISLPPSAKSESRHIRIYTHPTPIRVSYSAVQHTIPAMIESFKQGHNGQLPDIVIHIGMASTRHYYTVETMAHRDGYKVTDVDGQLAYEHGEAIWKEEGLPPVLRAGRPSTNNDPTPMETGGTIPLFPCPPDDTFLKAWKSFLSTSTDVRLSDDAGRYLCEYIYYTSLAHAYKEKRDRCVVFLHVPGWTDQLSIAKGKDVATALIKALATCWIEEPLDATTTLTKALATCQIEGSSDQ